MNNVVETTREARYYQKEAVGAIFSYLDDNEGNPVVAMPTGSGKTLILRDFSLEYLEENQDDNILILCHSMKVVQQDYDSIAESIGEGPLLGMYAAKTGRREVRKITVGMIQSVYRKPELFSEFSVIVVDEAHLVNHENEGMYRSFINAVKPYFVLGLTATYFRMGHGLITDGDALFDEIVCDYTHKNKYNKLVKEGYLSPIYPLRTEYEMDTSGLPKRGGDFAEREMSERFNRMDITRKAVAEIVSKGSKYKSWLLFAIDIEHAENIAREFWVSHGIKVAPYHGGNKKYPATDENMESRLHSFERGMYRGLVTINKLTTGFDYPGIDLIAVLRPTESPVFHVQSTGRGGRVAPGKTHCLYLDFAGNAARLGPINNIIVPSKKGKGKGGEAPVKYCKRCGVLNLASAKRCIACGQEFPIQQKITPKASQSDIVESDESGDGSKEMEVVSLIGKRWSKVGSPDSVRVTYVCKEGEGKTPRVFVNEWICLDHPGFASRKAVWWSSMVWGGDEIQTPMATNELVREFDNRCKNFRRIESIRFKSDGRFHRVSAYKVDGDWWEVGEK